MENPFIYGTVVKGKYFTNREKEIKELNSDLVSGQNILLFSPRRYGKTSLIFEVKNRLVGKGIMVAYVDFFALSSKNHLLEAYSKALIKATRSKLDDMLKMTRDLFSRLRGTIVLKPDGAPDIELSLGVEQREVDLALEEVFESPQKIAEKKKKPLVVIFDEFQELLNIDPKLDRKLRAVIQHHQKVTYVFMGSKQHLIGELFFRKDKALYQSAKPFSLGKIPKDKFSEFIKSGFASSYLVIKDKVIQYILEITGCHPYYTQQLCHEVWNLAREVGGEVTKEIVNEAVESVVSIQSYAYTEIWDSLTPKQKALLIALSLEPKAAIFSADFNQRFRLGPVSSAQYATKVLEQRQLLEKVNGEWHITDVFFKKWILQKLEGKE